MISKININQTHQLAITTHQEGKLEEAEILYQKILEIEPKHPDVNNNLGVLQHRLGRLDEAETNFKKAIELKPDYADAYNNLGGIFKDLNRVDEAETNFKKAIELKPDYVDAHYNLGVVLYGLGKLEEAEITYKKLIELKPDLFKAYNNLGTILQKLGKLEEAEMNFKKSIKLKSNYAEANNNLAILLKQNKFLKFLKSKKIARKIKENRILSIKKLIHSPIILKRKVEKELVSKLYHINSTTLSKTKSGPLFGNGMTSNYQLFDNENSILKIVEEELIKIIKKAIKSEIYIIDSFFNILKAGGGSKPHNHINSFDKAQGLVNQKYSLTYYLSVGDQNCVDPGIFKLNDPDEEILPTEGMIMIIPADRKHSAVYSGKIDRVMSGINFYCIS